MTRKRIILSIACLAFTGLAGIAEGQPAPAPTAPAPPATPAAPDAGMVTLDFPDAIDLRVLVDYVGKRQGVNFIYDDNVASKRVTIKAPKAIPAASLMTLLESLLKINGLTLVATEVPGVMRIELGRQLTSVSVGPGAAIDPADADRPTLAITRVIALKHAATTRVEQVIQPFLSGTTASVISLPEHGVVIVTDFAANLKRIEEMIAIVDRPGREVLMRLVQIRHVEAGPLAQKVTQLLTGKARARDAAAKDAGSVTVVAEERTNQLVVVGPVEEASEAIALIASLDTSMGMETKVYRFGVASPAHVDSLVRKLIGEAQAKRLYSSATDAEASLLIATTTPEIHTQIETLRQSLDKPLAEAQSPVRFYKLQHAKAKDVLETLRNIEGEAGLGGVSVDGVAAEAIPGVGGGPASPSITPTAPTAAPSAEPVMRGPDGLSINRTARDRNLLAMGTPAPASAVRGRNSRVMVDEPSNTVIVIAPPSLQAVYEKLIQRLDVRRPQVLVEATVVSIDTTNGFELGVEFSRRDDFNNGGGRVINFSSFGLSKVNETTGELTLRPGVGFNGAVISSDIADIILHALQEDDRVKVVSRPSVLINDNATGTLLSESEEPFASVNASTTVATTSFGGYSSAGTSITVTPQISEGEQLKLEYEITLSSFGEDGSATLPPSRQKNSLAAEATIPNGYTIVVGGLTRENLVENIDRIPFLGSIPGLEYLFSNRSKQTRQGTLFVFIRAVILRDDKFADLKELTRGPAAQSQIPSDFPASEPVEMGREPRP